MKDSTVFVRCVTYHYVGRVVRVTKSWIELEDCSWVADSGRFSEALETGRLLEVERIPGLVKIARSSVVDVCKWNHAVPVATK